MKRNALVIAALCINLIASHAFAAHDASAGASIDSDGNGTISRSEFSSYEDNLFKDFDRNQDGVLDKEESRDLLSMNMTQQGNAQMHEAPGTLANPDREALGTTGLPGPKNGDRSQGTDLGVTTGASVNDIDSSTNQTSPIGALDAPNDSPTNR